MSSEVNPEETCWNEIKIARETWPPNVEKILLHYNMAEKINPKYFQIYKDRARLFYVLNQIEKSNEDYEKWRSLDTKWRNEVDIEIDLRKNFSNKNIYPWEKLKKYFEKDSEVIKREFERADRKENREKRRIGEEERAREENRRREERRIEKNRNKKEQIRRNREEGRISKNNKKFNRKLASISSEDENFDLDENIVFMYYDAFHFQIISNEIENGFQHTVDSILKKDSSFKGYFEYLDKIDENGDFNFTKLYEFCKIKLENEKLDQDTFEKIIKEKNTKFGDFFISNKKYLEKWNDAFCNTFMILYQHLHGMSIDVKKYQNFEKSIETNEDDKQNTTKGNPAEADISKCCKKLIDFYKNKPNLPESNIELMEEMSNFYDEVKSLKQISDITGIPDDVLRKDFRSLSRIPKKLKEMVNQGKLGKDVLLSIEIAFFATDYYLWDGDTESEKEEKIIELSEKMALFFKDPKNLELKKEFFTTKVDYSKPISAKSQKKSELDNIYENWPVIPSKTPFNFRIDRTKEQYRYIVFYSKSVEAAKFVRRWENENVQRIPKIWASEIIDQIKNNGHAKQFVLEHSGEFQD